MSRLPLKYKKLWETINKRNPPNHWLHWTAKGGRLWLYHVHHLTLHWRSVHTFAAHEPCVGPMEIMNNLDYQNDYWDRVASEKTFTHSLQLDWFRELVPFESKVLDYGCGYGRTCAFLEESGYVDVIGVDISSQMINRGFQLNRNLNLQYLEKGPLPFSNDTFTACTMLAVLTCIPTDMGQKELIDEIYRILNPNGILYLSDYPLQKDTKNLKRYAQFESEFSNYGIFRLPDGGVVRHHDMSWIYHLLARFEITIEEAMDVLTMNGSKATIFQIIARKR